MSTSLLYHGFGIIGYDYVRTDYQDGHIHFTIRQPNASLRCPACGSSKVSPRGSVTRTFRTLPIGSRHTFVILPIPRVACEACNIVRQVHVPFADHRRTYTKAFERYASDMCQNQTIQDVARHLGVSWDVIKDIQKKDLKRRFGKPKLKELRRIAIDEIAVAKGHRYRTLVMDLDTGAVVFVGEGKGADALKPFWKRLKSARSKIEAVAMDMSPAYFEAVTTNLPKAAIVFDRFHVIKLFNDKLSELRRSLYHNANQQQKKVLKGSRWLLLKASEHLDDTRNEQDRLQQALALNQPLLTAYYLKEELRLFWDKPTKGVAKRFLKGWLERARASEIKILITMAKTVESHMEGLLSWYDHRISSGPMEGTNNKIKTMKRQAYGYRDMEFFELKILSIHEAKYALVG